MQVCSLSIYTSIPLFTGCAKWGSNFNLLICTIFLITITLQWWGSRVHHSIGANFSGMNVARLNFSHGDHATHGETLSKLRRALLTRRDKHVAIMLVRTRQYENMRRWRDQHIIIIIPFVLTYTSNRTLKVLRSAQDVCQLQRWISSRDRLLSSQQITPLKGIQQSWLAVINHFPLRLNLDRCVERPPH